MDSTSSTTTRCRRWCAVSRFARKVDRNHGPVVDAFELAGCSVLSIASVGNGAPDLVIGCAGRSHLVEVKPDTRVKAVSNQRANQVAWATKWRGGAVHVVRTTSEAFELANLLRMTAGIAVVKL